MSLKWNKKTETALYIISSVSILWILVSSLLYFRSSTRTAPEYRQEQLAPKTIIDIPDDLQGLGTIKKGEQVRVVFHLDNIGTNVLYIEDVNPDCTCTDYTLSRSVIPPNEDAVLTLTIDTKNKYGDNQIHAVLTCNTEEKHHFVKVYFDVVE